MSNKNIINSLSQSISGNNFWIICFNLLFEFIIIAHYRSLYNILPNIYDSAIYYLLFFSINIGIRKEK